MNPAIPIEKQVVLVGAGNAHLVFLRKWRMAPWPGVAVTLVSEFAEIPYSAMVPGHIGREFRWDEVSLDLVRFCRTANARFVAARVTGIDPVRQAIHFANRPEVRYDVLSLGLGSLPDVPAGWDGDDWSMSMRPLGLFVRKLERLEASLTTSPRPFHLVVVGGGASGCELALAIRRRFASVADFRVSLLQANARLLPSFPDRAARLMQQTLQAAGIDVRLQSCVIGGESSRLRLSSGQTIDCDGVVWATSAAPPPFLRASGLSIDDAGFLQVGETLQSLTEPAVFGTGDCVTFQPQPALPRNGVHAVRQGQVLFENVREFLHDRPLRPFRPQRYCLCLMNTSDGEAILSYGSLVTKGRFVRRLKERIDRKWLASFSATASTPMSESGDHSPHLMRCGGCGAKVGGEVLNAVVCELDVAEDPRVVLGTHDGEDAAVHRVRADLFGVAPERLVEVQTVDYFRAFVDDPYLFGRIAALHAVSDLYAMNARPFSALAIATLPYARSLIQAAELRELLAGASRSLAELGVVLTGGHTSEGQDLSLGFAVTGYADESQLFRKNRLAVGDALVLTKPLGTGAIMAAWMRGECSAVHFDEAIEQMLAANQAAADVFAQFGVRACTDITGFGLAGHLLEMLDASRVSARLCTAAVPRLAGFEHAAARGILSTLHPDNVRLAQRVRPTDAAPAWMFDPQTSGGLLAGVPANLVNDVLAELHRRGLTQASAIGEVIEVSDAPLIEWA